MTRSLHSGIDPHRLAFLGGSAGGYLAMMMAAKFSDPSNFSNRLDLESSYESKIVEANHLSDASDAKASRSPLGRVCCVVSLYGYGDFDWHGSYSSSAIYRRLAPISQREAYETVSSNPIAEEMLLSQRKLFYIYLRQRGLWRSVVLGEDDCEERLPNYSLFEQITALNSKIRSDSPTNNASHYPATFLCHGTGDDDVPYEEFKRLQQFFTIQSIPVQAKTIQSGDHFFAQTPRELKLELVDEITEFIMQSIRA
jgi:acetyl esterase/lipase